MAGIGFSIQRLMMKGTYRGALHAWFYAAIIGSGPWVISMMTLALISLVIKRTESYASVESFFITITYTFCFSLIATGPWQLTLSRFTADALFRDNKVLVSRIFVGGMLWNMMIGLLLGTLLFAHDFPGGFLSLVSAIGLTVVLSGIWTTITFVSAQKNYHLVIFAFVLGYVASGFLAILMFQLGHWEWMLAAFTLGQLLLLIILTYGFHREYCCDLGVDFSFLSLLPVSLPLLLCGLTYNLGIWADKIIYWFFSPISKHIGGWIYTCPIYDVATYLSFLTIAPGMAVFLLKIESDFALAVSRYQSLIERKASIFEINDQADQVAKVIRNSIYLMLKVQGGVTILLLLNIEKLIFFFNIGALQSTIFKVSLLGAFLCVLLFSLLSILFYFDRLWETAWTCVTLVVLNVAFTFLSIHLGSATYGFGFVAAVGLSIIPAALFVSRHLSRMTYRTFTSVKIDF